MGLVAEHIDAEPLATFRPFERLLRRKADERSISVILDMGYSGTRIVVAQGREIVLIKRIDIGGKKFTEAIAKQLNLPFEEACDLREQMMRDQTSAHADNADGADAQAEPSSVGARPGDDPAARGAIGRTLPGGPAPEGHRHVRRGPGRRSAGHADRMGRVCRAGIPLRTVRTQCAKEPS
jgi:hypothetical protein